MNFIVLHMDKDEKVWMNLIYQKCFFSIYEAVCVFRFLVCIYGIPVWISTLNSLASASLYTYIPMTHTRTRTSTLQSMNLECSDGLSAQTPYRAIHPLGSNAQPYTSLLLLLKHPLHCNTMYTLDPTTLHHTKKCLAL